MPPTRSCVLAAVAASVSTFSCADAGGSAGGSSTGRSESGEDAGEVAGEEGEGGERGSEGEEGGGLSCADDFRMQLQELAGYGGVVVNEDGLAVLGRGADCPPPTGVPKPGSGGAGSPELGPSVCEALGELIDQSLQWTVAATPEGPICGCSCTGIEVGEEGGWESGGEAGETETGGASLDCAEAEGDPVCSDREGLVTMALELRGGAWLNTTGFWEIDYTCDLRHCDWHGVTCEEIDGVRRVVGIDLSANGLVLGSEMLPVELARVTELRILNLSDNNTMSHVELPPEWGQLCSLEEVYMEKADGSSMLAGSIPYEWGGMRSLRILDMSGNLSLDHALPGTLGETPVERIDLRDTRVDTLEAGLGDATSLVELRVTSPFGGSSTTIPPAFGNLVSLRYLELSGLLQGSIPPELGQLSQLEELILSDNRLVDAIPPELGNLENLQLLRLNENELSGAPPSELGNLTQLIELDISFNEIEGEFPASLGNLADPVYLRVNHNRIWGILPPSFGDFVNLQELFVDDNLMSGELPEALMDIGPGVEMRLYDNLCLWAETPDLAVYLDAVAGVWTDGC